MRTVFHLVVCAAVGLGSLSCQPSDRAVTVVPDVTSASEAQLHDYVGRRVSMHGLFSLAGKAGPYILAGERSIYLLSSGSFSWDDRYTQMEGQDVRVTGMLRYAHYPNAPAPSGGVPIDRPADCFYFEAESASVELSQNGPGGPSDGLTPREEELYQHIKSEIANCRGNEPLEQFLARLHVQDAPFDRLYCNQLDHENRVYHLGRFFLRIDVEHRTGGLYTGYFSPALQRDDLTREQRLQEFNKSLGDYFREKQKRLDSNRQEEDAFPEAVLHRGADAYYHGIAALGEKEREQEAGDETRRAPAAATGRVTDRRGVPVAGAEVVVEVEGTDSVLGRGTTDENGRFTVALSNTAYRGLTLTVTKQEYARWALAGIYGGIVDYPVRMDRALDPSYLSAVVAQGDPEERLWMLPEVIGSRQMGFEVDDVYPFLGAVRPDLLQVIRSGAFKEDSVSARARQLLEFWHDPADASLFSTHLPVDISGQTISEVCKKWADCHFAQERVEKRTLHTFSAPILGLDQKHALVTFRVEYYHWGYSQKLVLFHDGQAWKLVMVQDDMHWHKERNP